MKTTTRAVSGSCPKAAEARESSIVHQGLSRRVKQLLEVKPFGRAAPTIFLVLVILSLIVSGPVAAEQPSQVITALGNDGVFIHNRRDDTIDRDRLVKVVQDAQALGYKMGIVIPLDPLPELRAFVLRVQQGGEFDIILGFGLDGEIEAETGDELGGDRLHALAAVRRADGSPEDLAELFLTELTTDPEATMPESVRRIIKWVIWFVAIFGIAILVEWIWRSRSKRGRPSPDESVPTS